MAVDAGKVTYAMEVVAVEDVATVKENVVAIRITPTTLVTLFTSGRFLRISAVPIGILFRETVEHILAVKATV